MELKCTEKHSSDISAVKGFVLGFFVLRRVYTRSYLPLLPPERGREQGGGGHTVNNKRPNQFLLIPVLFQRVEVVVGGGRVVGFDQPPPPLKGETS